MHSINYGLVFAVCFFAIDPSQALAQTANPIPVAAPTNYNNIEWSQISSSELTSIVKNANPSQIPSNAWGIILGKADWFQLSTNVQYYITENVDWSLIPTKILEFYNQPSAWPESPQKEAVLRHCAVILRSSVDTNWLSMIARKLTNDPAVFEFTNHSSDGTVAVTQVTNADILIDFESFSKGLLANLDEYAGYLTNPKLKTYLGAGYSGEIQSPQMNEGMIHFGFVSQEGPIRDFNRLTRLGYGTAGVQARFYPNGKLSQYDISTPQHANDKDSHFSENGQLQHVGWLLNEKFAIHIEMDAEGNPKVGAYFLTKLTHKLPK